MTEAVPEAQPSQAPEVSNTALVSRDGIYESLKGAGSSGAVPLKEPFKRLTRSYIDFISQSPPGGFIKDTITGGS